MPFSVKKIKGIDTSNLEKLGNSVVDLAKYTEDEFSQVASALQGTDPDPVWNKPLPKPRRGTTVYADGTNWNPGSGEGPYWFDGVNYHPMGQDAVKTPQLAAFDAIRVQKFTASGTYTPSAGMLYCIIEGVGSGGGGGGVAAGATTGTSFGSGGGGSGGYSRLTASAATIGVSQTVTIGTAGAGGAAGLNNGSNGGDCSVGALLVAKGGSGGKAGAITQLGAGGAGGIPGTGDVTCAGQPGTYGGYNSTRAAAGVISTPGNGGSSFFGGGAGNTATSGTAVINGVNASNYGGGGSGGYVDGVANGNASGGNGSPGLIVVTEFCWQPYLVWGTAAFATLSNGNLTLTSTTTIAAAGASGVAASFKSTGKYYFENTFGTIASASTAHEGIGVGLVSSSSINSMEGTATTGAMVYIDGSIWLNGSSVGSLGVGISAGDTIGVAIDLTARLIWFRRSSGTPTNWNNNGAANPATGVGGLAFPSSTAGAIPFASFGGTGGAIGDSMTANFGGSTFVTAAPVGFAGWQA